MTARTALAAWAALVALALPARAQLYEQVRRITQDQAVLPERREREAAEDRAFFAGLSRERGGTEAGGFTSLTVLWLDEIDHDRRAADPLDRVTLLDTRVWINHVRDARHNAYLRLRKLELDFDARPGVPTIDERTKERVDVDLAHYEFAVGDAQARAGRLFLLLGRGLALAQALDGAQVTHRGERWSATAFGATSLERQDNLDTRLAGFDRGHNDRDFYGLELERRLSRGRVYAYGLQNDDHSSSEDRAQAPLNQRYESQYYGAGGEATWRNRLGVWAELVAEGGRSRGFDGRADIDAWAALASAAYLFPGRSRPTATFDYAFGSGDPNRISVTSSLDLGPSSQGDKNFLYFGQYDGGLALAPRLSNLEVWRAGMRARPFAAAVRWPADLLAGFKVSTYHKDVARGGISDPLATQPRARVGFAGDLFAAWKIVSDLNVVLEYGTFKPSRAYPVAMRDTTERFALTTTLSF